MKSGRLYSLVTKSWPRIAAGLVVVIGLLELVVGGMTADSRLEAYLLAWAGTTGGLWFLFERAEHALGTESRQEVADRLGGADLAPSLKAIPDQFSALFDNFFGERHFTLHCFRRSVMCSGALFGVALVLLSTLSFDRSPFAIGASLPSFLAVMLAIVTINILPDYMSLLQTRLFIGWAAGDNTSLGLGQTLFADGLVTLVFGSFGVLGAWLIGALGYWWGLLTPPAGTSLVLMGSSLASALFTSSWLWLYAASVLVSRVLLRMNSGVGFLLRVTDVENQPFRSMGFVSVLIVSGLFLLGLPFVLL